MRSLFALLRSRLTRFREQMAHLPRVLGLVWRASGWWTLLWAAILLLQGLLPAGLLYLTRQLVDSLVDGLAAAAGGSQVWLSAALVAMTLLAMEILRAVTGLVRAIQSERLHDFLTDLVHRQSSQLDLAFYDWPEFHNHLHRARSEASYRPQALLDSLGGLLQYGVTLLGFAAVLIPYGWWVSGLLVASTLPALLVVLHYGYQHHIWHRQRTEQERRCWYLDWLLTSSETAAELRLLKLGEHFRGDYRVIRAGLRRGNIDLSRRQTVAQLAAGLAAITATGAMLVWMLWRVQRGLATLGDLVLFYQAFRQGQHMMDSLLQQVGQLYYNSLFLGNFFEFLDLQPSVVDRAEPVALSTVQKRSAPRDGFRCSGLTFCYPGNERAVLQDFNLHVPEGQFVALVGPNGAGKSTLVKLLCRLYDPQHGSITWNGIDLRDLKRDEYRRITSVLFQQPVKYNATVSESLALGDLDRRNDRQAIQRAAEAAGADTFIRDLPRGYEQLLGKWFEAGAELSVGQWQRLALARAYFRQTRILILDEPTSAMDSWAEAEWLERFRELADGRTAIIITHRFTTAKRADVIHVLSKGRIVESGDHRQLLAAGGLYARSWKRQMQEAERDAASELGLWNV